MKVQFGVVDATEYRGNLVIQRHARRTTGCEEDETQRGLSCSPNAIGNPRTDECDQGRASIEKGHSSSRLPILIADKDARPDIVDSSAF